MKTHSYTGIDNMDELVDVDGYCARHELDLLKKPVWSQAVVVWRLSCRVLNTFKMHVLQGASKVLLLNSSVKSLH